MTKSIENLECSKSFTDLNFEFSEYTDSTGRKLPEVLMTRDGFTFLAVGVTKRYPPFCMSTKPAAAMEDIRIDNHLYRYEYLYKSQGGETVSRGVPVPELKVQFFPLQP